MISNRGFRGFSGYDYNTNISAWGFDADPTDYGMNDLDLSMLHLVPLPPLPR